VAEATVADKLVEILLKEAKQTYSLERLNEDE